MSQRNRLTFSESPPSDDGSFLFGERAAFIRIRKADGWHGTVEGHRIGQGQNGDVVVQRLRVVVVVDVGRGHPEGLRSRAAELLREVVITDADVDGVAGADDAASWLG